MLHHLVKRVEEAEQGNSLNREPFNSVEQVGMAAGQSPPSLNRVVWGGSKQKT